MRRRPIALLLMVAAVLAGVMASARPVAATHSQALDPSLLALPASALPPGAVIDHQGVSDNADADKSNLKIIHQNFYEVLGRITGYRMDFHYTIAGGVPAGTEYLASVFATPAQAQAAMNDAIGPGSLIQLIGTPLAHQCSVGDSCKAYSGPNPGTANKVVLAIFTDGPVLVETATQVPAANFDAVEPTMESILFSLLSAADAQIKSALNGGSGTAATSPTSTDTPVPPTATATPKAVVKHCKKGTKLVHGKCKKKKKKHH